MIYTSQLVTLTRNYYTIQSHTSYCIEVRRQHYNNKTIAVSRIATVYSKLYIASSCQFLPARYSLDCCAWTSPKAMVRSNSYTLSILLSIDINFQSMWFPLPSQPAHKYSSHACALNAINSQTAGISTISSSTLPRTSTSNTIYQLLLRLRALSTQLPYQQQHYQTQI